MLLSFALLAVVGGALAFKAKFQTFKYCTTTTQGNTLDCKLIDARIAAVGTNVLYTTAQPNEQGVFGCTTLDQDQNVIPLTCSTPTTITTRD